MFAHDDADGGYLRGHTRDDPRGVAAFDVCVHPLEEIGRHHGRQLTAGVIGRLAVCRPSPRQHMQQVNVEWKATGQIEGDIKGRPRRRSEIGRHEQCLPLRRGGRELRQALLVERPMKCEDRQYRVLENAFGDRTIRI